MQGQRSIGMVRATDLISLFAGYDACAGVVKLVDAPDSKSGSERSVGSSPTARTILFPFQNLYKICHCFHDSAFIGIVRFAGV